MLKDNVLYFFIFIFFISISLQARLRMPDFMILGVTKCGTTSLYEYLSQHPKIAGSKKKELHYFEGKEKKDIKWYQKQFPQNVGDALIGEASPGYFWKNKCLERILRHCPKTRFILIFRDPVKRIVSEYLRRTSRGKEKESFEKAILRANTKNAYLNAGCYVSHLERWLRYFPESQFKILILEDLINNPEDEVNKVFTFLKLNEYKLPTYKQYNSTKKKLEVKPEVIERLKAFYAPYNKKLEAYLRRTLPWS